MIKCIKGQGVSHSIVQKMVPVTDTLLHIYFLDYSNNDELDRLRISLLQI